MCAYHKSINHSISPFRAALIPGLTNTSSAKNYNSQFQVQIPMLINGNDKHVSCIVIINFVTDSLQLTTLKKPLIFMVNNAQTMELVLIRHD